MIQSDKPIKESEVEDDFSKSTGRRIDVVACYISLSKLPYLHCLLCPLSGLRPSRVSMDFAALMPRGHPRARTVDSSQRPGSGL